MNSPSQPEPILLVEDSPEDREATLRAFKKSNIVNPVYCCKDGKEALDFLFRRNSFADPAAAPRPGIVLLDLNLPGIDGRDVLTSIKADPGLKSIPVVVLTTSRDERDIRSCYEAGANSYIHKPVNMERFVEAIQRFKDYWFNVVVLPGDGCGS